MSPKSGFEMNRIGAESTQFQEETNMNHRLAVFCLSVFSLAGIAAYAQSDGKEAAGNLYKAGMRHLSEGRYGKSRLSLQTLINSYPDSPYTPNAYLAIADSFYREGGVENLLQADAQYQDFLIYFPAHESAYVVKLKHAAVQIALMKASHLYAVKAEEELRKFIAEHPDNALAPLAKEALESIQRKLNQKRKQ